MLGRSSRSVVHVVFSRFLLNRLLGLLLSNGLGVTWSAFRRRTLGSRSSGFRGGFHGSSDGSNLDRGRNVVVGVVRRLGAVYGLLLVVVDVLFLDDGSLVGGGELIVFVVDLLLQEPEHVVEHIVAAGLLSEEEGLGEFVVGSAFVGHLAENLNDDSAVEGRLAVDVRDEDLAVVEVKLGDAGLDLLCCRKTRE